MCREAGTTQPHDAAVFHALDNLLLGFQLDVVDDVQRGVDALVPFVALAFDDDGGFSTTEDLKELYRKIHCARVETSKCMDKISEYKADVIILSDDELWEKYCK